MTSEPQAVTRHERGSRDGEWEGGGGGGGGGGGSPAPLYPQQLKSIAMHNDVRWMSLFPPLTTGTISRDKLVRLSWSEREVSGRILLPAACCPAIAAKKQDKQTTSKQICKETSKQTGTKIPNKNKRHRMELLVLTPV